MYYIFNVIHSSNLQICNMSRRLTERHHMELRDGTGPGVMKFLDPADPKNHATGMYGYHYVYIICIYIYIYTLYIYIYIYTLYIYIYIHCIYIYIYTVYIYIINIYKYILAYIGRDLPIVIRCYKLYVLTQPQCVRGVFVPRL